MKYLHTLLVCMSFYWLSGPAYAERDTRLAVLIGHEQGWSKDPKLQYALRGDVRPLGRLLHTFGFKVKTLENPSPQHVRNLLRWLHKRAQMKPTIDTFLFYYSGHSDRTHLHLGPKKQGQPVSYHELVHSFKRLPFKRRYIILDSCFSGEIIRKFGSIRRYRHLIPKGARAKRWLRLQPILHQANDEKSVQVLSSGLAISWESPKYKASIFTHHLLQGLRGRADRDTDGSISIDELFNYVSDAMMRDIQEKPKMFGVVQRSQSYALAPAYNSHLVIDSNIQGRLHVSVANFYWSMTKQRSSPVRLALVHGKGTVELRKGKRCWKQSIYVSKGHEIRLPTKWKPIRCQRFALRKKGSIVLEAQTQKIIPTWFIEGRVGIAQSSYAPSTFLYGGEVGIHRKYWGVYLGLWGASVPYVDLSETLLSASIRTELGYRHDWDWIALFGGSFVELGGVFQNPGKTTRSGLAFQYGLVLSSELRLTPSWGLGLHTRVGMTLTRQGQRWNHKLGWSVLSGCTYRF